jgi:hypothetical protein
VALRVVGSRKGAKLQRRKVGRAARPIRSVRTLLQAWATPKCSFAVAEGQRLPHIKGSGLRKVDVSSAPGKKNRPYLMALRLGFSHPDKERVNISDDFLDGCKGGRSNLGVEDRDHETVALRVVGSRKGAKLQRRKVGRAARPIRSGSDSTASMGLPPNDHSRWRKASDFLTSRGAVYERLMFLVAPGNKNRPYLMALR